MSISKQDLADLYAGKLPSAGVRQIISRPKDADRFQQMLQIVQEHVSWPERILLPLGEHLFIVQKDRQRIVKCDCGHEFGDWRQNWKLRALILARDDEASLQEIYPGIRKPDPELCEVREFICPGCGALLKVEVVPVGYPIIFDSLPDIDAFYRDWLEEPLSEPLAYDDRSCEITSAWAAAHPLAKKTSA